VKRHVTLALIACLAMSSFIALAPSTALADTPAQCFPPGVQGDYPPAQPGIEPNLTLSLSAGFLKPGATASDRLVVLNGHPGREYCGILLSRPINLGVRTASSGGVLDFDNINVPSDFELNALHHLDVYRVGALVGAFDFCVTSEGKLTSPTASCGGHGGIPGVKNGGNLAHTGLARLADLLKAAGVAFAAGVLFLYLRRRRAASVAI
jgi:hypothetical protein